MTSQLSKPENGMIFWYKNHRGEESYRHVRPITLWWGATEYHPAQQWLLKAFDFEKNAERDFAVADMRHGVGAQGRADFVSAQGQDFEPLTTSDCEMLKDPNVVHANMLRGGVAKPSWAQIKHLYPEQFPPQDAPAQLKPMEGHGEPCALCDEPCNSLTGNPGLWPVGLCHPDGTGITKWHHHTCVVTRLFDLPTPAQQQLDDFVSPPPQATRTVTLYAVPPQDSGTVEALELCRGVLADLTATRDGAPLDGVAVISLFARAVEAESKARAALANQSQEVKEVKDE